VAGNTVMVGTEDGRVVGLNRASGEIIWEFQTSGKVTASPVVAENTLFVASRDGRLYAVEAR
jgi:outer membrane protein assembly factor BamB